MSTIDYNLHEEYKTLCLYSYKENVPDKICGWAEIIVFGNKNTGYFSRVYYKTDKIVIVSRGTEIADCKDILNDLELVKNKIPTQVNDAMRLYKKIKNSPFSDCDITFVGHSLGGSISEIMAVKTGCPAVTFNPYGIATIKNVLEDLKNTRIINYGDINDAIFASNIKNNIGEIRLVSKSYPKYGEESSYYFETIYSKLSNKLKNHFLENIGMLKNSINIKDRRITPFIQEDLLLKGEISKNVYLNKNNKAGHWVTIDGNHVFIED